MDFAQRIAEEQKISQGQAEAVLALLADGATVPFIARYRKEAHGSLDEVAIAAIKDRSAQLIELEARRESIVKSLTERDLLNAELAKAVQAATSLTALEDIYLPYRPKRRTRASIAREKGLEPLALLLLEQKNGVEPEHEAQQLLAMLNVRGASPDAASTAAPMSVDEALGGARDIIAEQLAEDGANRKAMRAFFVQQAQLSSRLVKSAEKGHEDAAAKFRDYFDWQEKAAKVSGHRLLAMLRGEQEGFLTLHFLPENDAAVSLLSQRIIKNVSASAAQVRLALEDGYKRLLAPAMETEMRSALRQRAEDEAIKVFARNLRELLLAPALGQKSVLAIDPGLRTGCKIACLDAQGSLLHYDLINIISAEAQKAASVKVLKLYEKFKPQAVAVGNGTGGRETEAVVRALKLDAPVIMVSESGASVYSASELARKEFPELDLTVRGAISIGRRLMDPLAELVKIDPKAIGVGQYQHDVDQSKLKNSLEGVIESCVNAVGVELNTASAELLRHVSGLGPALAQAIVKYREENGPFASRKLLLKVPRLGPKAFEQAAGFLRVRAGKNPLDASAVHPESYPVVEAMAKDLNCKVADLLADASIRSQIKAENYVGDKVGLPTVIDIIKELEKPGRDPRESFEVFSFNENVNTIDDLSIGMRLPGIVTNITNFGAFVDIGVHQDGLVHISRMSDRFVDDPHSILKVQQKVTVTVLEVDKQRKRIALSMRSTE